MTTRFRSDDSGVRRVAMMGGAELVGADAAAVLIEGLHDGNAAVREAAARALGEHQGTAVAVAVIGALTDPEPAARQAAAQTLADKKEPGAASLLIEQAGAAPGCGPGHRVPAILAVPVEDGGQKVECGLKMKGVSAHERQRSARTLLGLAGLLPFENAYPDSLSGGMKQRVGIVRGLAPGPKVLLLDDPFGALDAQTRSIMQQILTNMWQQPRISVLFVTHEIDEAIFLSDRDYVMSARPGTI